MNDKQQPGFYGLYVKQSDNKHLYYIMEVQRDTEGNVVDTDKIVKIFHSFDQAKQYLGE